MSVRPWIDLQKIAWPTVAFAGIVGFAAIFIVGITTDSKVNPDMLACVEAGGSWLDMTHNELCLIGLEPYNEN